MRKQMAVSAVVLSAAGFLLSWSLIDAGQPKPEKPPAESSADESVRVRYARAHLELAKMDLRRAMELNVRMPNVLPLGTIDALRRHVEIDEEQLKQYLKGENADLRGIYIRSAEAAVKIAEANLKRDRAIAERLGDTSSGRDVEHAMVVAKLAKLNLERIRTEETSQSELTHLQWEIEELRNQVLDLQLKK